MCHKEPLCSKFFCESKVIQNHIKFILVGQFAYVIRNQRNSFTQIEFSGDCGCYRIFNLLEITY